MWLFRNLLIRLARLDTTCKTSMLLFESWGSFVYFEWICIIAAQRSPSSAGPSPITKGKKSRNWTFMKASSIFIMLVRIPLNELSFYAHKTAINSNRLKEGIKAIPRALFIHCHWSHRKFSNAILISVLGDHIKYLIKWVFIMLRMHKMQFVSNERKWRWNVHKWRKSKHHNPTY